MAKKYGEVVSMRVPIELAQQLAELAAKLDRTPAWVARQALIVHLKSLKEQDEAAGG